MENQEEIKISVENAQGKEVNVSISVWGVFSDESISAWTEIKHNEIANFPRRDDRGFLMCIRKSNESGLYTYFISKHSRIRIEANRVFDSNNEIRPISNPYQAT